MSGYICVYEHSWHVEFRLNLVPSSTASFLRQGTSLNLKLTDFLARLARKSQGSCLYFLSAEIIGRQPLSHLPCDEF